ncbi:thioesterase domain-containing protein, putative [Allopseudospirillum japonicum]|uniref:Thioesterase domain-containing protein, putative n=1 Tax=Allopseudospirillum japonicum TaxID=64971 RepID=A0A1H6T4Y3_9GAMM|nr:YiiD C-terminal domain-containing protein [Allopseudospirillum japonicum]SEI72157.1 thioesterase domain-containing protein, putative [Allopseudospirillum japonicum]
MLSQEFLDAFLADTCRKIPLVQHLGIQSLDFNEQALQMKLALAPLINDKGTGFGGGMNALVTLAGWMWVTLTLEEAGLVRPVVVKSNQSDFLAPITQDFELICRPQTGYTASKLIEQVKAGTKAGISLRADLQCAQKTALTYQGDYRVLAT